MDAKERWDDLGRVIRTGVARGQTRVWTALPVQVAEDSDGFTTKLQVTIQGKHTDLFGNVTDVTMDNLPDCPVVFVQGGGFVVTHPIKKGDEGIAIFSARCIDAWFANGGVQPQAEQRWNSLSDGMYLPGVRSWPRKLGGDSSGGGTTPTPTNGGTPPATQTQPPSTTTLQIRTESGQYYIELTDDSVNIVCKDCTITASDKVLIKCPTVEMTGDLKVDGKITAGGKITSGDDVVAGASSAGVSLSWTQTGAMRDSSGLVTGNLNVVSSTPTNVGAIGDKFSISGAINLAAANFPGAADIINQIHTVTSFISSQNFTAALSALPGQIGQITGNPTLQAVVSLLTHEHHGVQPGPGQTQQPVTDFSA